MLPPCPMPPVIHRPPPLDDAARDRPTAARGRREEAGLLRRRNALEYRRRQKESLRSRLPPALPAPMTMKMQRDRPPSPLPASRRDHLFRARELHLSLRARAPAALKKRARFS